ncbi:unnamed protein product [Ectocarpus sp. CCAP 1310/34]|nr:unnamed protein product [Ectocarpus sp. CCAP 1310/34]
MVEKVEAEVVKGSGGKSPTVAKTEELIDSAKDVFSQLKRAVDEFDSSQIQEDVKSLVEGIKTNTPAGVSGERGEAWAAAQVVILLFVLMGNLPLLGGSLEILAGPGLLLGGAGLATVSALQLGRNFSPWPEPAEGGVLNTTGVYSLCRHPMYAGLVAFSLGLGFSTDSFTRIALACLLGYVLDRKADMEEEKLVAVHPAYKTYKEEVSKFVPTLY